VHQRGFGMVFQDYALFPHKNVAQNVDFGLRMTGWPAAEREERLLQVLALVGLEGFEERAVYDLSGGEQQRVALARALAPSPRLILMDEPLGSLDRALRERLMGELRSILRRAGTVLGESNTKQVAATTDEESGERTILTDAGMTTIYVTHDQEEAFAIADRIMVMNDGRIEQTGTPLELYRQPRNAFVARFMGMENLLDAKIVSYDPPVVNTVLGNLRVAGLKPDLAGELTLLIRPEAGRPLPPGTERTNTVSGRLQEVSFRGRLQIVTFAVPLAEETVVIRFSLESTLPLPSDEESLAFHLEPTQLIVLERC
jgi:ABC-type Fe3+/spermidine/putrescine transport system ATPase subunit